MILLNIHGLMKTTLLDYPGHLACTIFLGGCNLRCPFCHNSDLVINTNNVPCIPEDDVFQFLQKRKNTLEGVCITGGEPTLRKDLPDFIRKIKDMNYKVKLDTNGTNPQMVKDLIQEKLIDYVAMDIKNSWQKYNLTVGLTSYELDSVKETVTLLLSNVIPYEFRTTVVRELHTKEDLIEISKAIAGCDHYYLQSFVQSDNQIQDGFTAYSEEELAAFLESIKEFIPNAKIRGQA